MGLQPRLSVKPNIMSQGTQGQHWDPRRSSSSGGLGKTPLFRGGQLDRFARDKGQNISGLPWGTLGCVPRSQKGDTGAWLPSAWLGKWNTDWVEPVEGTLSQETPGRASLTKLRDRAKALIHTCPWTQLSFQPRFPGLAPGEGICAQHHEEGDRSLEG